MLSLRQYARFLLVGGFVGLLTLGIRELIGWSLGADTVWHYSASVIVAYALGILCSFVLNYHFTFSTSAGSGSWARFTRFVAVALAGMLATWLLSLALRYGLHLDDFLNAFARPVAFAIATLTSSLATYPLNAWLVFHRRLPQG